MKPDRQRIFDKSGGKCWYCGACLNEEKWHKDHVEPVIRNNPIRGPKLKDGGFGPVPEEIKKMLSDGMDYPERDNEDNLVPACAPCNLFKATFSIEELRREIGRQVDRARKSSVNFRTAERFGLIQIIDKPIQFWFERNDKGGV